MTDKQFLMPKAIKDNGLLVPLGLYPHQAKWAQALGASMGGISPQIAVLRAFKAYVRMWQAGQLPADLTPEACAEVPPGLPGGEEDDAPPPHP